MQINTKKTKSLFFAGFIIFLFYFFNSSVPADILTRGKAVLKISGLKKVPENSGEPQDPGQDDPPLIIDRPMNYTAKNALKYVLLQQQKNGCFKSYNKINDDFAHSYDQAVVLTALANEIKLCRQAGVTYEYFVFAGNRLVDFLSARQNSNGSWFNAYQYLTGTAMTSDASAGVSSWLVCALKKYADITGNQKAKKSAEKAWIWIKSMIYNGAIKHVYNPASIVGITESNIDGWYAARLMQDHITATQLSNFLMTRVWNSGSGYFNAGQNLVSGTVDITPYLDNQTWGAMFLQDTGQTNLADQALQYARNNFAIYDSGDFIGLDSRISCVAVNYELSLFYISAQGPDSDYLLPLINAFQQADGGLKHDSQDISDPWHTTAVGVNSTAWLYSVNTGSRLQGY